ncbi:hypothetical protein [Rhodospirillaceae bacterium SYSU D60014]|uniref:hypothetical protein n=1 Tax=Virgifigura deserti TaxID=2268457 RepID=UPI000E66FBB7
MSLKALLRPFIGGDAETIARLEAKLAGAQAELDTAQKEANAAFLEAEGSDNDVARKRAEKARGALVAAQGRIAELDGALREARNRKVDRDTEDAAAEQERRWLEVEKHTKAREQAAKEAEEHLAAYVASLDKVHEAGAAIANAAPVAMHPDAALLHLDTINASIRAAAIKDGVPFAGTLPFGAVGVPTLAERIADANAYVGQVRSGRRAA